MKIVVIGGGNGSYAAAADFAEAGHDVRWWRRNASDFAQVVAGLQAADNTLVLTDVRGAAGRFSIGLVTDDLAAAIAGGRADRLTPTPATAQADIADKRWRRI
jgi:opine dehydrogenase